MRKPFETQMSFGVTPIQDIDLSYRSRDELKPILEALKKIYLTPEISEKIFKLLHESEQRNTPKLRNFTEEDVALGKKSNAGRPGLNLWQIFVLAVVRYGLSCNYARLHDLTINHIRIRQFLGLENYFTTESIFIGEQTIIDNLKLLDNECLEQINSVIAEFGMMLSKKKSDSSKEPSKTNEFLSRNNTEVVEEPSPAQSFVVLEKSAENEVKTDSQTSNNQNNFHIRIDSFPIDGDVHFPTDYSLLLDCAKEIRRLAKKFAGTSQSLALPKGLQKMNDSFSKVKSRFIGMCKMKYYKSKPEKISEICTHYLEAIEHFVNYGNILYKAIEVEILATHNPSKLLKLKKLQQRLAEVLGYTFKLSNQLSRRVLSGETIPQGEKIFSIYEPHVEWVNKGRTDGSVNIGNVLSIATNEAHFIVIYKLYINSTDVKQLKPIIDKTIATYPKFKLTGCDSDKGYYSLANVEYLKSLGIENVIIPKKGKLSAAEKEVESSEVFRYYRKKHAVIESNINMLQHHGLNRCLDHGIEGLERAVGCSVIAYNLHRLGNLIIEQDEKHEKELLARRKRYQETKKAV